MCFELVSIFYNFDELVSFFYNFDKLLLMFFLVFFFQQALLEIN
jgi:hypothetical protein